MAAENAPEHLKPYLFKPGAPSNNPSGRPKGFKAVAAQIMRETQDGAELVQFLLDTFRNANGQRSHAERMEAVQMLLDRGIGKPIAMVELAAQLELNAGANQVAVTERLEPLSDDQLEALARAGLAPLPNGQILVLPPATGEHVSVPRVIEAEAVEKQP